MSHEEPGSSAKNIPTVDALGAYQPLPTPVNITSTPTSRQGLGLAHKLAPAVPSQRQAIAMIS
jgi:hypothetical protein